MRKEIVITIAAAILILAVFSILINQAGITGLISYEQSTTFEAEELVITGVYSVSSDCLCLSPSNQCIKHSGHPVKTGSIEYDFNLTDGLYDIVIRHCPEEDGDNVYELYINNNLIRTFEEKSDSAVWEEYIFDNIDLNQEDKVKISCTNPPSSTFCRIDQVIFRKIRQTVNINETIENAEENPINSTIKWRQEGEIIQEASGEIHNYELEIGDYELEIIPEHSSIKKIKLDKSISSDIIDLVDIDEIPTPNTKYSRTYAIEPKDPEIEDAAVTITATGTELYKCQDWDFDDRECYGEWVKLMDTIPGQEYSFVVDCGYKEKGGCSCKGIRFVDLFSDYTLNDGDPYTVTAKVYTGTGTNPSKLIDLETIEFNSLPQYSIDNNSGHYLKGNLIIEKINESGVLIKFHNRSHGKLLGDNTFKITINSSTLGPDTIHLSCSEEIDIGDTYGDFQVTDIDKKLSGSDCSLGEVNLISPANNSNVSNPVTFIYSVYDSSQSIDFCELIIDGSVYQTDYSIIEISPQYFSQNLSNETHEWSVNCTTSNGYEIESEKRVITLGETSQIKGYITDSNNDLVESSVKVYDSEGQLVLSDDEAYDFYLGNGEYDVKVNPENGSFNEIYIHNLTVNANIVNFTRLEDSPENLFGDFFVNLTEVISWEINPLATYDAVSINLSYGNGSDLVLWKCTDFDFDNQTCRNEDNWTIIQNLSDGPNEVVFNLSANDPVVAVAGGDKPPIVTLNYPPDSFVGYTNTTYSLAFNCTAEDKQGSNKGIESISLYLTNNLNISFSLNQTINYSGNNDEETALFNKTLAIGNYTWNCLAKDEGDNYDWGDNNRSLEIRAMALVNDTTPPIVNLISPANNSIDNDGYVTFNYNVTDNESSISYCELIINDSVVDTDYTITEGVTQSFAQSLGNGTYEWLVNCTNTFNLTGSSETRILTVNVAAAVPSDVVCCGVKVSTTPEVASQGEKVLVSADVVNLLNGLAATPADIIDVNTTIYRIDNGSYTTVVNNIPMTFLNDGLWYYEFFVGNNASGSYVASVTMLTNQTTPFVKEASDAFTIGEKVSGLTITGVSPDLMNINKTTRLAAEIKYNGIAVDSSLILNAELFVEMLNGTNQTYNTSNGLQVDDGIIYVDGVFNETGIYYLDWSAAYLSQTRVAREIVVVVGWEEILEDINATVNIELLSLIKESRQYLVDLLTDMEYLQEFSEEEIFLITDSVNSMSKVVNFLESGQITNEEAEAQFNQIRDSLMNQLGDKITASAIGLSEVKQSPLKKLFSDWRSVMFVILLLMFAVTMIIMIILVKIRQGGIPSYRVPKPVKVSRSPSQLGKRRYEILIDKIKQRRKNIVEERKQVIKELKPKLEKKQIKRLKPKEKEKIELERIRVEKEIKREIPSIEQKVRQKKYGKASEWARIRRERAELEREREKEMEREWKRIRREKAEIEEEKEKEIEKEWKLLQKERAKLEKVKAKHKKLEERLKAGK
jgi:hypothetical protein